MSDPYLGLEVAGQFRIVQRIGSGGMGSVYMAEQPEMNRHVAIKILHTRYMSRPDLVSRFRREARAMSQLSHPNTARVFMFGQLSDGACYFVMEYMKGRNLAQAVRAEGPFPARRAIPILLQVCGALEEAHQIGIVHRDLKPENVFLTVQGGLADFPKVLDFGLAKVGERQMSAGSMILTQEGMVFGTPEFMSPEQARGETLDARSDIYSLGVILYELLTGKLPFDARNPMEFIQLHVKAAPIPLRKRAPHLEFPDGLEEILQATLAKRPDDRFQSAAALGKALRAAGRGAMVRTLLPFPSPVGGSVRPGRRTRDEGRRSDGPRPDPVWSNPASAAAPSAASERRPSERPVPKEPPPASAWASSDRPEPSHDASVLDASFVDVPSAVSDDPPGAPSVPRSHWLILAISVALALAGAGAFVASLFR